MRALLPKTPSQTFSDSVDIPKDLLHDFHQSPTFLLHESTIDVESQSSNSTRFAVRSGGVPDIIFADASCMQLSIRSQIEFIESPTKTNFDVDMYQEKISAIAFEPMQYTHGVIQVKQEDQSDHEQALPDDADRLTDTDSNHLYCPYSPTDPLQWSVPSPPPASRHLPGTSVWSVPSAATAAAATTTRRKQIPRALAQEMIDAFMVHKSARQLARDYSYSYSTCKRLVQRWKTTGTPSRRAGGGRPKKLSAGDLAALESIIKENRGATLAQYVDIMVQKGLPRLCDDTLRRYLHELGYRSRPANPSGTHAVRE
ncbi:hypothetical protein BC936DRAFT_140756 [Jimgerdemannia flammicorona]|uniref:Uncharacterized protein n=2 Tax=Jimgerdemannia flammicorona TaxID=994334 RepID=A0A433QUL4_9FUNG|nr:hypothetical protein BC936DRAFT_140756 [Jimgerdemannia flammicorona]RUS33474.1 hypothetical protein BC938DRAFT_471508 [Jimgerdemannia flammicorona]